MGIDRHSLGIAVLRILVGGAMANHGFGKIFGGRIEGFAEGVAQMGFPMPVVFAWAAALSELAGGLCLAAGLWTRPAAFFIFCTMSVALFIRHGADPFSVKELAYLYWSASLSLMLLGGGRYSVSQLISGRFRGSTE